MIQIEQNIPMPAPFNKRGRALGKKGVPIYPYRQMNVGDSFHVDTEDDDHTQQIRVYASGPWSKKTGFKFSVRKEPNGCRVWRTE